MTTIAIDFGTSNTVISIIEADTKEPQTLRIPEISRQFKLEDRLISVIPTLVFIKEENQILLGEKVRSQRLGLARPERFFKGFKRELAANFQAPPREIDGNKYSAESVAESFLKYIWQQLELQNIKASELIFTAPVGAFERYLDWFRELGNSLGVANLSIVDESTAAALGYAVERPGSLILVIDFGGGTLDLSLVRTAVVNDRNDSKTKVLKAETIAKSDAYVGGEDIDRSIVEDYLQSRSLSKEEVGEIAWQNLLEIAEKLKIKLSQNESAKESWLDEESFISYELELNRDRLADILENSQLLEQLRETLDEVLTVAAGKGITKKEIERVLLVGGSCLIPAVQQLIISYFGKQKVKLDRPFDAVARGGLNLTKLREIQDYLRHTYAIKLWEPQNKQYTYFDLFEKGIKYPCKRSEPLILQAAIDGQKEIRLDIGEVAEISRAEVTFDSSGKMTSGQLLQEKAYRSLDSDRQQVCVARLNPPGTLEIDRISVEFEVNEARMLVATVRDLLTGKILVARAAIAKLK